LCYKTGKYDEAETAVLKAIELAPDNPVHQEGLKEIRQHRE
jgi:cytochrome c-type biogenesis protein CcmH/NrfG